MARLATSANSTRSTLVVNRRGPSTLRSAVSSAFTGPLPSATVMSFSLPTSTRMVASDRVTSWLRAFQRRSSMTRNDWTRKYSGTSSISRRASSSKLASAPS